jgi:hypothetical protein
MTICIPRNTLRGAMAALALLSACSGDTGEAGSAETNVMGALGPLSIDGGHAGLFMAALNDGTQRGFLVISDRPDPCSAALDGFFNLEFIEVYDVRPGAQTLSWVLFAGEGGLHAGVVEPFAPESGHEPEAGEQFGYARVAVTPTTCTEGDAFLAPEEIVANSPAATLELRLASVDARGARGELSVELDGGRVAGTFDAMRCSVPEPSPRPEFTPCP